MNSASLIRTVPSVLAAASVTALALADVSFQGLGHPMPGNFVPGNYRYLVSTAKDVNIDGSVVVGAAATAPNYPYQVRRFRWTATGGMEVIPEPAGATSQPTIAGVSSDGRITTSTLNGRPTGMDPFSSRMIRQSEGGPDLTMFAVPTTPPENLANSALALGISGSGEVVVGYARGALVGNTYADRAVVWEDVTFSASGRVLADAFPVYNVEQCFMASRAAGVSRDGRFAVGFQDQNYLLGGVCVPFRRALRWSLSGGGVPLVLDPGSIFSSSANAASADGTVVVGETYAVDFSYGTEFASELFRWTAQAGMTRLGSLPGSSQYSRNFATDVSDNGRVVVGQSNNTAVVWDSVHGLRTVKEALQANGVNIGTWNLQAAQAISGNGRVIVGYGLNPMGAVEAWRAELPVSCPADFNGNGQVTVQDVFDFLLAYFAHNAAADVNGVDGVTVQDIFDFLVAYFAGCP